MVDLSDSAVVAKASQSRAGEVLVRTPFGAYSLYLKRPFVCNAGMYGVENAFVHMDGFLAQVPV